MNHINKLTTASMCLAAAFVLPFLTGQIPQIGSMLLPMHIPVLLCGFFCGGPWGMAVGFMAPIIRSLILGVPPMFPAAVCMAFEMATYGFVVGFLHNRFPKKKGAIYAALICAMLAGRLVWGMVMLGCVGFDTTKFGVAVFFAGAFTTAVPGIILQLVLVPMSVMAVEKIA